MKIRDLLAILNLDGWTVVRMKGSHRVLKHPEKPGIVVLAGHPSLEIDPGTLKSVLRQAKLEDIK